MNIKENIIVKEGEILTNNKARETAVEIESVPSANDRVGMRFKVADGVDIIKKKKEAESVKVTPTIMKVPEEGIGIWDVNNNRIIQLPMDGCSDKSEKKTIKVNQIKDGSKIKISPHPFRKICDIELETDRNSRVLKSKAAQYLAEEDAEYLAKINSFDIVFIDFETGRIFPMRESYTRIFIGNFEVNIKSDKYLEGTIIKYEVSYMPIQSEAV